MTGDPRSLDYDADDLARHPDHVDPPDYRHPFARDYDRLIHASALRRLQGTTQVITPREAEFLRTRLTHTLEVAQLARRLGERLGAHPDVCENAAVLHDFGHPPFGHIGEEALCGGIDGAARRWGLDPRAVGGYEGNAQNLRLVARRLEGSGDFAGLNLTRATLDASLKYPWSRGEVDAPKWGVYPSEADVAGWLRAPVPAHRTHRRSLEAQIMDWADDVAYAVHDMEDWYLAGFVPLGMLTQSATARERLVDQIAARRRGRGKSADRDELVDVVHTLLTDPDGAFAGFAALGSEYDGSGEAHKALRVMRKRLFGEFAHAVRLADPDAPPRRHHNDLVIPPAARLRNDVLRDLIWIYVIDHPRTATYQHGQRRIVAELYRMLLDAVADGHAALGLFPRSEQRPLRALIDATDAASRAEVLRLVADHVGSLTDRGAVQLHQRLTGQGDVSFFAAL